jgi:hypothetical protein
VEAERLKKISLLQGAHRVWVNGDDCIFHIMEVTGLGRLLLQSSGGIMLCELTQGEV